MVYACFVAKMSKMAFTRFGGQFQFEKSMLGRLDNSGAGVVARECYHIYKITAYLCCSNPFWTLISSVGRLTLSRKQIIFKVMGVVNGEVEEWCSVFNRLCSVSSLPPAFLRQSLV